VCKGELDGTLFKNRGVGVGGVLDSGKLIRGEPQ
jgi:hypothetical protein